MERNPSFSRRIQAYQNLHQARRSAPANATPRPRPEDCICQRNRRLVLCSICSFKMIGRVRTVCPAHPQTIFLMDLDRCPQCLGYAGILKEYE